MFSYSSLSTVLSYAIGSGGGCISSPSVVQLSHTIPPHLTLCDLMSHLITSIHFFHDLPRPQFSHHPYFTYILLDHIVMRPSSSTSKPFQSVLFHFPGHVLVTSYIYLKTLISAAFICISSFLINARHSGPNVIAGLRTVLRKLPSYL